MIVADLHGNRLNFEKLLAIADLANQPRRHLVMQEVCHGGPEYPGESGGCMSHLLLEDCIRLKTEFPERFHFLLSNHELAELGDFPICKSRRMLNVLFRCGINEMYGPAGENVRQAYLEFLGELPAGGAVGRGVFISHSCPDRCDREPFDLSIFERPFAGGRLQERQPGFQARLGARFPPRQRRRFCPAGRRGSSDPRPRALRGRLQRPNKRQVILDGCCSQATYLMLPVGKKLTQTDVVARIHGLHNSPQNSSTPKKNGF